MTFRRFLAAAAFAAIALAPGAATAQVPAGVELGATVKDVQGGVVGTITAINGTNVTIRTDRLDATVPATSFTVHEGDVLFGMTQAQLDAAVDQANQAAQAAFAVGTQVKDRDGAVVGAVQALDAETVTVQMGEQQIRLPRTALAASGGALVTGATLAELQAAAGGGASGTQ